MTQKYFIGKCGGEDCERLLSNPHISGLSYCGIDGKQNPDCKNCSHGKTLEEWAQKLEDNKDFQAIIDDKDVSYAEIAEVMIKDLLGGGGNEK